MDAPEKTMNHPIQESMPDIPSIALPNDRSMWASWWVRATLILCSPPAFVLIFLTLMRALPDDAARVVWLFAYCSGIITLPCLLIAFVTAGIGSFRESVPTSGKILMWSVIGLTGLSLLALA
jgi:hypothetical protein